MFRVPTTLKPPSSILLACLIALIFFNPAGAQPGDFSQQDDPFADPFAAPMFDFDDGFGPPPGFGPGGPMGQQDTRLVGEFDADRDGWLNAAERKAARAKLAKSNSGRRFQPGPPGMFNEAQAKPVAGRRLAPADVASYPGVPLYDTLTIRTLFLEFESADWEKELADFKYTDVEVPARLTVDGREYRDVGVHFHGMSSYMMVREGQKRSMVLTLDWIHPNQQLEGYRKLNLLNSHEDASFMRTVLALQVAREFGLPAPRANWVRVVINGECWGLYVNQQHFNKDLVRDYFGTTKGARWKIAGSPGVHQSFTYLGDDLAAYKNIYTIKSKDAAESWLELINLCRVIDQTPPERLEAALAPILDIDGTLKFLAWDITMANGDGFWTRSSDIDLYEDKTGRFHIVPYDANECFSMGGGPGGPGGGPPPGFSPGMRGVDDRPTTATAQRRGRRMGGPGGGGGPLLDPLASASDSSKALIAKLLAVPAFREKYLGYVHDLSARWLDWEKIGPIARQYHDLIDADVKADTRKTDTYEQFAASLTDTDQRSIKVFAQKRRQYLLANKTTTQSITQITKGNGR
ncbi:MAG: CotH kinase family protein [Candidatus Sumerlaeia bacterium]